MYRWRDSYFKMFKPELRNEVISLGAIYQASAEIKKIAWEGKINNKIIEPLIYSVYQTTSDEIEDIYINLKRLNTGLDFLRKQLVGDAFSRDAEVTRYFEAKVRIDTAKEWEYFVSDGILNYVLKKLAN